MDSKKILVYLLSVMFSVSLSAYEWKVTKSQWTEADELKYEEFISAIGNSSCNTVPGCLKTTANPYREGDNLDIINGIRADCARFAYLLRAYFASKNGLPFSYVSDVEILGGTNPDVRYSNFGNKVVRRQKIVYEKDGLAAVADLIINVWSAMFRIPSDYQDPKLYQDFYSVKINREGIRPGTVYYDPDGHVILIYKVESDGRVKYVDTHPDNSVTRGTWAGQFAMSGKKQGGGFKRFRPIQAVSSNGIISDYTPMPNSSLPLYSLEQYDLFKNFPKTFHESVRERLAEGKLTYHPLTEMKNMIYSLCVDTKDRASAVEAAISAGIHQKPHPANLPDNIYGTSGEWETFSTPSRDARLKASFVELYKMTDKFINMNISKDPKLDYTGTDLKADMLNLYTKEMNACKITYVNSNKVSVSLSLSEISARLFDLSFSPYHCPELRWGASGTELSSCPDDEIKMKWYKGLSRLRNQIDRDYSTPQGFDVDQIFQNLPGNGVPIPPRHKVLELLEAEPLPIP